MNDSYLRLIPMLVLGLGLGLLGTTEVVAGPIAVDPAIPAYSKVSGVSGNLNSIGSDTLNNVMTLWAEGFRKQYPNVRAQIEGKGSSTAPPALIASTAQIGPMSREMKPSEIDEFEKKFGYPPTQVRIAVDALAVYVNKDNPLEKLTITEVDAIFSKERKCSSASEITTWGKLDCRTIGRTSRSACMAATRRPGPTVSSRRTHSARAISKTR
jgi:phosphate transport system substrate-binding protein